MTNQERCDEKAQGEDRHLTRANFLDDYYFLCRNLRMMWNDGKTNVPTFSSFAWLVADRDSRLKKIVCRLTERVHDRIVERGRSQAGSMSIAAVARCLRGDRLSKLSLFCSACPSPLIWTQTSAGGPRWMQMTNFLL